jgi:hypothetical protein
MQEVIKMELLSHNLAHVPGQFHSSILNVVHCKIFSRSVLKNDMLQTSTNCCIDSSKKILLNQKSTADDAVEILVLGLAGLCLKTGRSMKVGPVFTGRTQALQGQLDSINVSKRFI